MTRLHVMHVPGAHRVRDDNVARIARQADVCVHTDPDRRGPVATFGAALECAAGDATDWRVILQDDSAPAAQHWQVELQRCLQFAPGPGLMVLTYGWTRGGSTPQVTTPGIEAGTPYVTTKPGFAATRALAVHSDVLSSLLPAYNAMREESVHDDFIVSAWALAARCAIHFPVRTIFRTIRTPSLLGHPPIAVHPLRSIADEGPDWSSNPRTVPARPVAVGNVIPGIARRYRSLVP